MGRERAPEDCSRLAQLGQALRLVVHQLEGRERGARGEGGQRRREAVARAREALVRDDHRRARAEAPDRANCVLHRPDDDVDLARGAPKMFRHAAARGAQGANRECLVDDQVAAEGVT